MLAFPVYAVMRSCFTNAVKLSFHEKSNTNINITDDITITIKKLELGEGRHNQITKLFLSLPQWKEFPSFYLFYFFLNLPQWKEFPSFYLLYFLSFLISSTVKRISFFLSILFSFFFISSTVKRISFFLSLLFSFFFYLFYSEKNLFLFSVPAPKPLLFHK